MNKFNKKNQFGNKSKKFDRHSSENSFARKVQTLKDVNASLLGETIEITGIIESIIQTGGPTVFSINDGTATLNLKAFDGAGVRAHPELNEGELITAKARVNEFQGAIEGEISSVYKLTKEQEIEFKKKIEQIQRERAKITPPEFLVKSQLLDKLKSYFTKAAAEIRYAVFQNRPIIIRHHNDTDGYSAGYALERAILPLVKEQHTTEKAHWTYLIRAPCQAPFYEIEDSIKDTAKSLSGNAKFSEKMPLVIIVDNGSSEEDLLAIQQAKVHGIDFIVVDHHYFDKDAISQEVLVHISPFLVNEDGRTFSAGMLCAELARFINPNIDIDFIPAMAGLADRINNPETMKDYLALAEKKGYTKELMQHISLVLDFVSAKLRFMEAREYVEVVFGEKPSQQKKLVAILAPQINKMRARTLEISEKAVVREKFKDTTIQIVEIEKYFPRGSYPKPGQIVGMTHDSAQEKHKLENVLTVGLMSDMVILRATETSGFSVHKFKEFADKEVPEAFIEGGGHHLAGALRFVPATKDKIVEALKVFVGKKK